MSERVEAIIPAEKGWWKVVWIASGNSTAGRCNWNGLWHRCHFELRPSSHWFYTETERFIPGLEHKLSVTDRLIVDDVWQIPPYHRICDFQISDTCKTLHTWYRKTTEDYKITDGKRNSQEKKNMITIRSSNPNKFCKSEFHTKNGLDHYELIMIVNHCNVTSRGSIENMFSRCR